MWTYFAAFRKSKTVALAGGHFYSPEVLFHLLRNLPILQYLSVQGHRRDFAVPLHELESALPPPALVKLDINHAMDYHQTIYVQWHNMDSVTVLMTRKVLSWNSPSLTSVQIEVPFVNLRTPRCKRLASCSTMFY